MLDSYRGVGSECCLLEGDKRGDRKVSAWFVIYLKVTTRLERKSVEKNISSCGRPTRRGGMGVGEVYGGR